MAIIKYGHIIAEARGKLNGTVFSRNSSGAYMRAKVTPSNPASNAQQLVRSSLSSIAQAWRGLTNAQRAAWDGLATQVSRTNIFGDNVPLSGFNLFGRLNRNLAAIGVAIISDAPAIPSLSQLLTVTLAAAAGAATATLAFTPTPVPAGHTLVIQATPQLSAGIKYTSGRQRQLQLVAAAGASPANIAAAYIARFGALVATNRITAKAFYVHAATGFNSVPLSSTTIVAA